VFGCVLGLLEFFLLKLCNLVLDWPCLGHSFEVGECLVIYNLLMFLFRRMIDFVILRIAVLACL